MQTSTTNYIRHVKTGTLTMCFSNMRRQQGRSHQVSPIKILLAYFTESNREITKGQHRAGTHLKVISQCIIITAIKTLGIIMTTDNRRYPREERLDCVYLSANIVPGSYEKSVSIIFRNSEIDRKKQKRCQNNKKMQRSLNITYRVINFVIL